MRLTQWTRAFLAGIGVNAEVAIVRVSHEFLLGFLLLRVHAWMDDR